MAQRQKIKGSHKGRQSAHNAETRKYQKQFFRTEANLKRKGKTNKKKRNPQ